MDSLVQDDFPLQIWVNNSGSSRQVEPVFLKPRLETPGKPSVVSMVFFHGLGSEKVRNKKLPEARKSQVSDLKQQVRMTF